MKTWKRPQAVSQTFRANEYVAACYRVTCWAPNDNASCSVLYDDTNRNGSFDADVDTQISFAPYAGATFKGCGGYHEVKAEAKPTALNGILLMETGDYNPCYYWIGNVLDPTEEGDMDDFHFTDSLDKIVDNGNAS